MKLSSRTIIFKFFTCAAGLLFMASAAWCQLSGVNSPISSAGAFFKTDLDPGWFTIDEDGVYDKSDNIQWVWSERPGAATVFPTCGSYYMSDTTTQNPAGRQWSAPTGAVGCPDQGTNGVALTWIPGQGLLAGTSACFWSYINDGGASARGTLVSTGSNNATNFTIQPGVSANIYARVTIQIPGVYTPGVYTTEFTVPKIYKGNGQAPTFGTWENFKFMFEYISFLSIENTSPFNFGTTRPLDNTASTVIISPNNSRSGTANIVQASGFSPAGFQVTGSPNTNFNVTFTSLNPSGELELPRVSGAGAVLSLTVDTLTTDNLSGSGGSYTGVTDSTGKLDFNIGGTLRVPDANSLPYGRYRGTLQVRIDY